ncbi:MAG: translocation/assembly module TamB domain-containing protein, partial [Gemmatimonadaceae bacterium]
RMQPADSLIFALDVDSLGGLRRYLRRAGNDEVKALASDSLAGTLMLRGVARGWLDSLSVEGALNGASLYVRGDRAQVVSGTFAVRDVFERITGNVSLRADTVMAAGVRVAQVSAGATILDAGHALVSAGASGEGGALLRTSGDWRSVGDTVTVRLDTLDLAVSSSVWSLHRPSLFSTSPLGVSLDTLLFADASGARISGFVFAPSAGAARGHFEADSIPLRDMGLLAQLPDSLSGKLSLDLAIAGTRERPTMELGASAARLRYAGLATELVAVSGAYAADRATVEANVLRAGRSILDASVSYPVALTLFSAKTTDDSLRGRVHADSVDLALIEALSTKLRNSTGRLALDLTVSGKPDHPHVGGLATVRGGGIEVPEVGMRLADIEGAISVDPTRDSLTVDRLRWTSPASGGNAALQGSVVFRDIKTPRIDLRLDARNFRAVDKRGLARLDVSTDAAGLTLAGTPDAATLKGAVMIDRGTIYIPELVNKKVEDLTPEDFAALFDTTDVRNRSIMPQPPSALVENLRLDGVSVRVGDDVWLRSREANIKLGGTLNVTSTRDDRGTRSTLAEVGRADSARYKLALSGTLSADRGTYTLDLTAVQREFQVQSGRITFFGTPDFNPEIDVTAAYQVKQANRADIGINARIHGNFYPQPALELSSTDAYLSPSDLVSYLVTGRPSFALGEQDVAAAQRAVEFLLPTVNATVSRALRDQLGDFVDAFQIQSGAASGQLTTSQGSASPFRSFLSSTRLGGEKQIKERLFLSFSTGLCQLGSDDPGQQGLSGFVNAIEGKLEYRFPMIAPERFSLRAGREPPASALRCGVDRVRGFVATPQQWGLSLFRSWVF